jgi:hypothetical protein
MNTRLSINSCQLDNGKEVVRALILMESSSNRERYASLSIAYDFLDRNKKALKERMRLPPQAIGPCLSYLCCERTGFRSCFKC